jgi:serine/threonine protein kinase
MKIVVNPKYSYLRSWIEQIPSFFEDEGRVIYKARNLLKVFTLENGMDVNVKKYKTPYLLNRIVYSFFRKTKASRAYCNTIKIIEKGFDAAEAIAYIEIKRNGLFSDGYFISLQCHHVKEIREYYAGPLSGNENLIDEFTRYSAKIHDAGIYHLDYSPGNILICNNDGKYTFILVDVNRMKFMPVSFDAGCRNFSRLFTDDEIYKRIGLIYSQSRKNTFTKEEAVLLILKYKNRFLRKRACKKQIKGFFIKSHV